MARPVAPALAVVLLVAGAASAGNSLVLVSRSSNGTPANGHSRVPTETAVSGNGNRVVFESSAANLPQGDGTTLQVYVRDSQTGATRLVSKDNQGNASGSSSRAGGISADGRYVSFNSTGDGLPGANGQTQVWVHDLGTGRTVLASRDNQNDPAAAASGDSSLSASGRFVTFSSNASNLPGGNGVNGRVYVRDLESRQTTLVSRTSAGDPATGSIYGQTISSDGSRVAFYSSDANLPGGDGTTDHTYVRDLDRGRTILVDRTAGGDPANGYNASISGNGRHVAFESDADSLPGGDGVTNQVYLRDLVAGTTRLVARNNAGEPQDGYAEFAHPSGGGRYVQFCADAANLPGYTGRSLTYVRDMAEGRTRLVSRAENGDPPANGEATDASISLDGRFVVFESDADNLGGNTTYYQAFRVAVP